MNRRDKKLTVLIQVRTHPEFTKQVIDFAMTQGHQSVSRYVTNLIYKALGREEVTARNKGRGKSVGTNLTAWVEPEIKEALQASCTLESISDKVRRIIIEDLRAHGQEVDESKVKLSVKKVKA